MSTPDFSPGSIVGRYEILKRIGAGGMAEVYLARPRSGPSGERVAIKRLLPAFAHERAYIDMFIAEARLASTLHHPNIAAVLDVGVEHDEVYFAMEYVDGHDVRALLAAATSHGRPMPLAIALSITYGTTCALAYVHDPHGPHTALNVVHRDVSPSNILVSFEGAIKLVDFGIARIETTGVPRTSSGQLKGKIPYMSPEQCRARPLDGRSDLFSLGVVLYELTTNTRPFDRDSDFETLEAIVRGQVAPPSRIAPGYPADLEEIVLRLLATRPADRYPSAGALLVDLDRTVAAHRLDLSSRMLASHITTLLGRRDRTPSLAPPIAKLVLQPRQWQAAPPGPAARLDTIADVRRFGPELVAAGLTPEARVAIDRVVARCDALLEQTSPGTTDARDLPADAVAQLVGRAMRCQARGDFAEAVIALEVALSAARPEGGVDEVLATHEVLCLTVFHAFLGDQARTPVLSQHIEQLVGLAIDQRAVFLVSRIDGTMPVSELLATCGLPMREACRHLSQLLLREIVVLV